MYTISCKERIKSDYFYIHIDTHRITSVTKLNQIEPRIHWKSLNEKLHSSFQSFYVTFFLLDFHTCIHVHVSIYMRCANEYKKGRRKNFFITLKHVYVRWKAMILSKKEKFSLWMSWIQKWMEEHQWGVHLRVPRLKAIILSYESHIYFFALM
jgi:hypothetical protein